MLSTKWSPSPVSTGSFFRKTSIFMTEKWPERRILLVQQFSSYVASSPALGTWSRHFFLQRQSGSSLQIRITCLESRDCFPFLSPMARSYPSLTFWSIKSMKWHTNSMSWRFWTTISITDSLRWMRRIRDVWHWTATLWQRIWSDRRSGHWLSSLMLCSTVRSLSPTLIPIRASRSSVPAFGQSSASFGS